MTTSNSAGIQLLLQAEKEAQKIVQQARQYRTQRVKDARTESGKEIEAYKTQKEKEFKQFESEHTGTNTQAEEVAKKDVVSKLTEIDGLSKKSRQGVVDDLIKAVCSVDPKLHVNVVHK